jgi:hypothetical protein
MMDRPLKVISMSLRSLTALPSFAFCPTIEYHANQYANLVLSPRREFHVDKRVDR